MSDETEIRGVIPTYYGFLISGITQLREYWARKQHVEALYYAMELTTFLPNKIKEKIEPEKKRIQAKLLKNLPSSSSSIYAAQRDTNNIVYRISMIELEPFVDKIIRLLDENNLLTQSGQLINEAAFRKLEEEDETETQG
jgi:hypothetical protein